MDQPTSSVVVRAIDEQAIPRSTSRPATIMLLVSLGVFVNPDAAPMPWWFFLSSALGMFVFAVGYNLFLDWFAPPGAEDSFDRVPARN